MRSTSTKYLFVFILLIQSSQIFSQEVWDPVWQKNTATSITAVNLSPDGKIAVAGDGDGLIKAWNSETGSLLWDQTVSGQVDELIFSTDGTKLISRGSSINLLNPNTGKNLWYISSQFFFLSAKLNSEGKILAAGTTHNIYIWDIESQSLIGSSDGYWVSDIDFSSNDSMLVSTGGDSTLTLWNANTSQKIWTREYNNFVRSADFSLDDKKIVACDLGGIIAVWDVATGTRDWIKNAAGGAFNLIYTPDGSKIISGGEGLSDVQVWNSSNGDLLWTGEHNLVIHSLELNSDGRRILSAAGDKTIKIWDLNTGNLLWEEQNIDSKAARFNLGGDKIIAGGAATSSGGFVKLWHFEKIVQLTSSITNDEIKAGTTFDITWNSNNVTTVNLEFSTNNGSSWLPIATNLAASSGSYTWTVPAVQFPQCKIRISDAGDANYKDESSAFLIFIPSITLTNPANSDTLKGGTLVDITWTSDRVTTVNILYSIDNGSAWNSIAKNIPAANKSYEWQVPLVNSPLCKIAVVDSSDDNIKGESSGTFIIYKDLEITYPVAGSSWEVGSTQKITWNSSATDKIGIEYSTDTGGTWSTIISSIPANVGYYIWTVPNTPSQNCRLRIFNPDNPNEYDENDGLFIIFNRELELTSPNGGEVFIAGHMFNIKWNNQYVNKIQVEYSLDNGNNWNLLADSIATDLDSLSIMVPDTSSDSCKIKITDIEEQELSDESNSVFSIYRSSITVTNPKGGENWVGGTTQEIKWTSEYAVNVKIEYSADDGANWKVIINSITSGIGKYLWIVPDTASAVCKVRITDVDNPQVTGENDNPFSIEPATDVETENDMSVPKKFMLYQSYPNPFNPTATISYSVPKTCFVTIKVFDVLGNEITTLVNGEKLRGNYKVTFNGSNVTSGVYFYQIQAGEFSQTKKSILSR